MVPIYTTGKQALLEEAENPSTNSFFVTNSNGKLYQSSKLLDTTIFSILKKIPKTKTVFIFTDDCHSGTLSNLPFVNVAKFILDASGNTKFNHIYQNTSGKLSNSDITNLFTNANAVDGNGNRTTFNIDQALYPSKLGKLLPNNTYANTVSLANIIQFSGTRDNRTAGEDYIPLSSSGFDISGNPSVYKDANNNYLRHGFFTTALDATFLYLADLNTQNSLNTFTVEQFYTLIVGFMNNKEQISVCSTSQKSGPLGVTPNTGGVLSTTPFYNWFNNLGNAPGLKVENPVLNPNVLLRLLRKI
jgi:hypothetical protein